MTRPTPSAPARPGRGRPRGFTLVELLVVISIIALLIGLLLPTLAAARRSARLTTDLSNIRQIAQGVTMFHTDRGVTPTLSDEDIVDQVDPKGKKWDTRPAEPGEPDLDGDGQKLKDPVSMLQTIMAGNSDSTFRSAGDFSKVFQCPDDPAEPDLDDPNFPPTTGYFLPSGTLNKPVPVSYGFNADIMTTVAPDGRSYIGRSILGVINGPNGAALQPPETLVGQSANNKLINVKGAALTMLLADCGTIRPVEELQNGAYQDKPNMLAYMSNYMHHNNGDERYWGTLAGVMQTDWLAWRVPLNRHVPEAVNADWNNTVKARGGVIPVGFVDGHAGSFRFKDANTPTGFEEVKITPWELPEVPARP